MLHKHKEIVHSNNNNDRNNNNNDNDKQASQNTVSFCKPNPCFSQYHHIACHSENV